MRREAPHVRHAHAAGGRRPSRRQPRHAPLLRAEGLIGPIARTAGGHRAYDGDDLFWIGLVTCLRDAGLGIAELREFTSLLRAARSPPTASPSSRDIGGSCASAGRGSISRSACWTTRSRTTRSSRGRPRSGSAPTGRRVAGSAEELLTWSALQHRASGHDRTDERSPDRPRDHGPRHARGAVHRVPAARPLRRGGRPLARHRELLRLLDRPERAGRRQRARARRLAAGEPGVRSAVGLATKVRQDPLVAHAWPESAEGLSASAVRAGLDGSLDRLGVDHVDLLWAHAEDRTVDLGETVAAFGRPWPRVARAASARPTTRRGGCSRHATSRVGRA